MFLRELQLASVLLSLVGSSSRHQRAAPALQIRVVLVSTSSWRLSLGTPDTGDNRRCEGEECTEQMQS